MKNLRYLILIFVFIIFNCLTIFANIKVSCSDILNLHVQNQLYIQEQKERGRSMSEYNRYLFNHFLYLRPQSKDFSYFGIQDFFKKITGSETVSLPEILERLSMLKQGSISWTDIGGGLGIPMRELKRDRPELARKLKMNLMDLIDWNNKSLPIINKIKARCKIELGKNILNDDFKPELFLGNAQTFNLPTKTDLVTSFESIQYIEDKLALIVNWYNQLEDGGFIIIASEHRWAKWIINKNNLSNSNENIFNNLIQTLIDSGISIAMNKDSESESNEFLRALLIQKKNNTTLNLNATMVEVWTNSEGYTMSTYEVPKNESPVRVVVH